MSSRSETDTVAKTIRIPLPLYKRLAAQAKKQRRSFNAQAVTVLELGENVEPKATK